MSGSHYAWLIVACLATYVAAAAAWVLVGWIVNARGETVQSLPSEDSDVQLDDFRLHDGGETCFRCRNNPNEPGSLWCKGCAEVIHELDLADNRALGEK